MHPMLPTIVWKRRDHAGERVREVETLRAELNQIQTKLRHLEGVDKLALSVKGEMFAARDRVLTELMNIQTVVKALEARANGLVERANHVSDRVSALEKNVPAEPPATRAELESVRRHLDGLSRIVHHLESFQQRAESFGVRLTKMERLASRARATNRTRK